MAKKVGMTGVLLRKNIEIIRVCSANSYKSIIRVCSAIWES